MDKFNDVEGYELSTLSDLSGTMAELRRLSFDGEPRRESGTMELVF